MMSWCEITTSELAEFCAQKRVSFTKKTTNQKFERKNANNDNKTEIRGQGQQLKNL